MTGANSVTSVHNQTLLTRLLLLFARSSPEFIGAEETVTQMTLTLWLQPAAAFSICTWKTAANFSLTELPCLWSDLWTVKHNRRLLKTGDQMSTGEVVVVCRQIYDWSGHRTRCNSSDRFATISPVVRDCLLELRFGFRSQTIKSGLIKHKHKPTKK